MEYEIVETVDGTYMVLVNGFQIGGAIDASGAGNLTHLTYAEAEAWARAHIDETAR